MTTKAKTKTKNEKNKYRANQLKSDITWQFIRSPGFREPSPEEKGMSHRYRT